MNSRGNTLKLFFSLLMLPISAVLFTIGLLGDEAVLSFSLSITLLILANILAASVNFRQNVIFIVLQMTFFLFLIGGPLFSSLRGAVFFTAMADETITQTMSCYWISVFAMWLYQFVRSLSHQEPVSPIAITEDEVYRYDKIRLVSKWAFYIAAAANCLVSLDTILYRQTHSLLTYYADFATRLPGIVEKISDCYLIAFCLFLATKPSKQEFRLPCVIFIGISALTLLYGVRNAFMLNFVFLFVYLVSRSSREDSWFSGMHFAGIVVFTPILIVLMQAFDAFRRDAGFHLSQLFELFSFDLIGDFLVDQSVSSLILPNAVTYSFLLQGQPVPYSFGTLYNYVRWNRLVRLFTGEAPFIANSVQAATEGANLGCRLSYYLSPNSFLNGVGMGSAFVAELYVDFSYIGVFIGTLLLCWFIQKFSQMMNSRSPYLCAIALVAIRWIAYIPRDSYFSWAMHSCSFMNILFLLLVMAICRFNLGRLIRYRTT